MASTINVGLILSNRGVILGLTTPAELLEMAEIADASGAFSHVWVGDSIMAAPRLESITLMAAIAARTKRVRIGPACMATTPSRDPITLALQWSSLDQLSDGRMILATCMGGSVTPGAKNAAGFQTEYHNMGINALDRAARMEEKIVLLRKLWSEDRVTFKGKFYQLEDAYVLPKPVQKPPPIWVTSTPVLETGKPHIIERSFERVARLGDGWMTTAHPAPRFAELRRHVAGYMAEHGRSMDGFPCCAYHNMNLNADREAAFDESKTYLDRYYNTNYTRAGVENWVALGTPAQCADQLRTFVDAGATDILIRFPSWDQKTQLKRCIDEVLPQLI